MAICGLKTLTTPDAQGHPMPSPWTHPVRKLILHPLWVRERTHLEASGACVRCHTLDMWHAGSTPISTKRTNSPTIVSDASVRCLNSINTSSNHKLSKTKLDPLNLRTLFELRTARFNMCAPHLNPKALPRSSYPFVENQNDFHQQVGTNSVVHRSPLP